MSPWIQQRMTAGRKWFLVSWSIPLVAVVVVFGGTGLADVMNGRASVHWPTAPGVITASEVTTHYSSDSDHGRSLIYDASITYRFAVNGAQHEGHRVIFGEFSSDDRFYADQKVDRFPKGKQVTVHYKPGSPEECVLIPGAYAMAYMFPAIALAIVAVIVAVILINKWASNRRAGQSYRR